MTETTPILEIDHLNVRFRGEKVLHAINDLSLRLEQGESWNLPGVAIVCAIWLVVGLIVTRLTFRWIRKDS